MTFLFTGQHVSQLPSADLAQTADDYEALLPWNIALTSE